MILSDRDIRSRIAQGDLIVGPTDDLDQRLKGGSIDVRLGNVFRIYKHSSIACLDPEEMGDLTKVFSEIQITDDEKFIFQPGEFVLGVLRDRVRIPHDLVGTLNGRSSLGRLGIIIHATAGIIHPGFDGQIALEISNINRLPVALRPGTRVGQISLTPLSSTPEKLDIPEHGSKYSGETDPRVSRLGDDAEMRRG